MNVTNNRTTETKNMSHFHFLPILTLTSTKENLCSGILKIFVCHTVWDQLTGTVRGSSSNHLLACSRTKHLQWVGGSVSISHVTHQQSSEGLSESKPKPPQSLHPSDFVKTSVETLLCSCLSQHIFTRQTFSAYFYCTVPAKHLRLHLFQAVPPCMLW